MSGATQRASDAPGLPSAQAIEDPAQELATLGLERYVQKLLYSPIPDAHFAELPSLLQREIDILTSVPGRPSGPSGESDDDNEGGRVFHSVLYRIYTAQLALPWEHAALNSQHALFGWIRHNLETSWSAHETERLHSTVVNMPTAPEDFCAFAAEYVRSHRSSRLHPLFPFLRDHATYAQLRAFLYQETPLDIYFADLLCLMMAGLPARVRGELAANYWDEVGRGNLERSHRNLRLRLMERFGISERIHIDAVETFVWEQLALANLYFRAVLDRRALLQAVGIMLATEIAVPGRVECQLEGCRRVGLPEDSLDYLVEHVTVDVYHAQGWMNHVVLPILRGRPELASEVMVGVNSRLELASGVCDRMLRDLQGMDA